MPRRVLRADNAFVGASSDTNAWVFAEFDRGADALHWDGRSWAAIAFPDLHLRSSQRLVGGNIAAAGPRSVWVEYGIQTKDSNASTELLLRWHGASWHRIAVPLASFGVWSMARDGRGGLWLTADSDRPVGLTWFFYHVSRGRVTLVPAPAKRGSAQLYGAGQLA